MTRDKLLHITLGFIAAGAGFLAIVIAQRFGTGPAIAFVTTVTGVGYEVQQRIRGEGEPDPLDAIATAAPGWIAWALLSTTDF